jgi:hypothetical protein
MATRAARVTQPHPHKADRLASWRPDELFGLHPTAPMARYDAMGLIWMLRGEAVIELTTKEARLSDGLTYYRRPEMAGEHSHRPG